jgi:branched-subunit amino acid ABC-type transport system permease component
VWGQTTFYMVLVVVLLVRPQGLFGRQAVRAQ